MESYNIDKYNLNNIALKPLKKNFKIYHMKFDPQIRKYLYEVITIETPPMKIPFGIEKYNYKEILNIEFSDMEKNNTMYNFHAKMSQIDNYFAGLSYKKNIIDKSRISRNILQELTNKSYTPSVKVRPHKFDSLLRIYTKKNISFHDPDGRYIDKNDIKSKSGIFILNLSSLWISKYNYGLIWSIDDGVLTSNTNYS